MTKQLINAAVKAIESGKTRSEFVKARKSVKESVSSRAWYVAEPIVDQSRAPSWESMITRVRAAVAALPSRMRTL